jgi:GAF domain-containing protein
VIGEGLNRQVSVVEMLETAARSLVEEFHLKACHFRLLSRDQRVLEDIASYGLSEKFLGKGPVDAERSVAEALQGRVVTIPDCTSDPRVQYPLEHREEGIVTGLTVPLSSRGQVIGVMRVYTSEPRVFSQGELEFFEVFALFCTSSIIHSMFHQILEEVTEAIRSSLDLEEVLQAIVTVITDSLRAKGCSIRLLDPRAGRFELRAAHGLSAAYLERTAAEPGEAFSEALQGRCVAVLDARTDPRIRNVGEVVQESISSILFVPLMSRSQAIGVLSLYTHRPYEFSEEEMQLMLSIGEQCALAIRNAQMHEALKRRYEDVVDAFHQWFEHSYSYPTRSPDGQAEATVDTRSQYETQ